MMRLVLSLAMLSVLLQATAMVHAVPIQVFYLSTVPTGWPMIASATATTGDPDAGGALTVWTVNGQTPSDCVILGQETNPCQGRVVEMTFTQAGTYTITATNQGVAQSFTLTVQDNYPGLSVTRQEIRTLPDAQIKALKNAMLTLKQNGVWDHFVYTHMFLYLSALQDSDPYRNAGHASPAFLPWHRVYLRLMEQCLAEVGYQAGIPYWDWNIEADMADPTQSPLFTSTYFGGQGPNNLYEFGSAATWPIRYSVNNLSVLPPRSFGSNGGGGRLIQASEVAAMLTMTVYDVSPFGSTSTTGFRPALEGWLGAQFGYGHNGVHNWVGGIMLNGQESSNDPIFFIHHCGVDRIWDLFMQERGVIFQGSPTMPQQNVNSVMIPWKIRITDVLAYPPILSSVKYAPSPRQTTTTTSTATGTATTTGTAMSTSTPTTTTLPPFVNVVPPPSPLPPSKRIPAKNSANTSAVSLAAVVFTALLVSLMA